MKSKLCLTILKAGLLIAPLSLYFSSPTIAQARDRQFLVTGPVGSGNSDYRAELPQGSLMIEAAQRQIGRRALPQFTVISGIKSN